MKYCTKCGTQNEDNSIFCLKCGNKFQEVQQPQNQHATGVPQQPQNQFIYTTPQQPIKSEKKGIEKLKRFLKKFFGIVLCFYAFAFFICSFLFASEGLIEQNAQPLFIITACLCIFGAVMLLKKPKNEKTPKEEKTRTMKNVSTAGPVSILVERESTVIPKDIAKGMRQCYTFAQAQRDAEIMAESYHLASTTVKMDTFCMRYDLAMLKAQTLLQAEQAGVRGIKNLHCHDACIAVLNTSQSLKIRMLADYEQNSFSQAEALKTEKGRLNRYIKIKQELINAESTFACMEEYESLMAKVDNHIASLGGTYCDTKQNHQ